MQQLYAYTSFRGYLSDYYRAQKAQDPRFSYQHFSKSAGLKSPNYLKLVTDGTRDLTVANIHQFAKALKFTEPETEFFEALVLWEQASMPLEKTYYKAKMARLKANRVERQRQIKIKHLAEFPYLPAILVCAGGLPAREASNILAERFPLPVNQVKNVLQRLTEHRLLEVNEGHLRLTSDYYIQFDKLRSNADQKKFLKAQLRLSEQALQERYEIDAQFFAHTFTTLPSRIPGMIHKLAELLEDFTQESNNDPADNTMQLNIQFFPIERRS